MEDCQKSEGYCDLPLPHQIIVIMSGTLTSLSRALPKPKYTGEDEELTDSTNTKGPKIVGAGAIDESQIVIRVST